MKFYSERNLDNRSSSGAGNMAVKPMESRDSSFIGLYFDDKLVCLKKQEEKAIFEDNFDQLKKVRTVMKSITKAKKKLGILSAQKVQAIGNEDYETAQMIKNEMSKIQKSIMTNNDRNNQNKFGKGRGTIQVFIGYIIIYSILIVLYHQ